MVFGKKSEILFLCSFSEKQSEKGFFVTFWIENLPIQTRKTLILKIRKLAFFHRGQSMVFGQKFEILFLFSFSVKQSETRCFVTFWIENLPIQTRKTLSLKSRKLAFLHRGQSMVFGQKQESLFLFSFSAKYSKTKCFVSLQIEIQPFKTTKIWIQKSKKIVIFQKGSRWSVARAFPPNSSQN